MCPTIVKNARLIPIIPPAFRDICRESATLGHLDPEIPTPISFRSRAHDLDNHQIDDCETQRLNVSMGHADIAVVSAYLVRG